MAKRQKLDSAHNAPASTKSVDLLAGRCGTRGQSPLSRMTPSYRPLSGPAALGSGLVPRSRRHRNARRGSFH